MIRDGILQKHGYNLTAPKREKIQYNQLPLPAEDHAKICELYGGILELREQIGTESPLPYSPPSSFSLTYRSPTLGVEISPVECGLMVMSIVEGAPHSSDIREADVIVGVNCQRFEKHLTMQERVDILTKTPCPKVVHFERDSNSHEDSGQQPVSRQPGLSANLLSAKRRRPDDCEFRS